MKNTTRKEVRAAFKAIGYKVAFKRHPLIQDATNLGFIFPENGFCTIGANIFSGETYEKHRAAFELLCSFADGQHFLECTEQRILKVA
jgi:hypothetical protein